MKKHYLIVSFIFCLVTITSSFDAVAAQFFRIDLDNTQLSYLAENIIQDDNLKEVKLYPNPSTNYFYLTSNYGVALKRIAIVDIIGNTVWERKISNGELIYKIQVPVMNLKNGIYFVEIETNKQRITRKISKE